MLFHYVAIISLLKRMWSFMWTNLSSLHPRMLLPRLVEISQEVLENIIFTVVYIFSLSWYYFTLRFFFTRITVTLGKACSYDLNKLQSFFTQEFMLPEKHNEFQYIFYYLVIIVFKWLNLNLNLSKFSSPKNALNQILFELAKWIFLNQT